MQNAAADDVRAFHNDPEELHQLLRVRRKASKAREYKIECGSEGDNTSWNVSSCFTDGVQGDAQVFEFQIGLSELSRNIWSISKQTTVGSQGFSIQVGIWVRKQIKFLKEPCFSEFPAASGEFIRLLWKR